MNEVFVGVSGGVDSAYTVLKLKDLGYKVRGVYIVMFNSNNDSLTSEISHLEKALDIDIITVNAAEKFETLVVTPFIKSYLSGATPSPCTECNPLIKWAIIEDTAQKYGSCDYKIATGHYCRKIFYNGKYYITRARDTLKNQTYYLWKLPQSTLSRAIFPLGDCLKSDIKEYMYNNRFEFVANKRESMGVCFLKGKSYREFLLERMPELSSLEGGEIVSNNGDLLGYHSGYPFYTLAQRKKLPIPKGQCIIGIDTSLNRLTAGYPEDLFSKELYLENYVIIDENEFFNSSDLRAEVRGIGINPKGRCQVIVIDNKIKVNFVDDYAWAVTPGQPVVFYIDDRAVGGGYVCK